MKVRNHNIDIKANGPLFGILGINVIEDEGLALETARELKNTCQSLKLPFIFKASFDKANRSSVKSFRGPGLERGLKILKG